MLLSRGFGSKLTQWVMSPFKRSNTCINFNGNTSPYFQCKRGLRQGDPLSPFLFDLVTDTLCQILLRGQQLDCIQGLGPTLDTGLKCTHFLYADDTIFFLQTDLNNIEAVMCALLAFEALSGIKINYLKTKLVPIHLTDGEASHFAKLLGCKVSSFPLKYLGVPLYDKKHRTCDWDVMLAKIHTQLSNWKGSLLSFGGKLTLLNSVLSAVHLYMLSLYRLPTLVRKRIDRIRCKFFWQGSSNHRMKFALVAWKKLCMPKEMGGVGIVNLNVMNMALLLK
jgi:Reverse transcriptase (RNA-dependent DNA polymerase)